MTVVSVPDAPAAGGGRHGPEPPSTGPPVSDRLSDAELRNLVLNILVGGVDTSQSQLAHTVRLLADHPEQWELLRADPRALALRAVEALAERIHRIEVDGEPEFGTPTGIYGLEALPMRLELS